MELINCNLCGSKLSSHYIKAQDLLLNRLDVQAEFVQCVQCGLVYQNPRPSAEEMAAHYPLTYELYDDVALQNVDALTEQAIRYGMQKRCNFVTQHRKSGRILDIGCAAGTFLLAMRALQNWEVHGVEYNREVALAARKQYGLDVMDGEFKEGLYPEAYFDAVTLWDVLEHLPDPLHSLQEIRRILKPGGVVVIRVPNLASWDVPIFGKSWIGWDAPRHLYVFTPQTLQLLLVKAGLQWVSHSCRLGSYMTTVMSIRSWMTAHHFSTVSQKRVEKLLYHPLTRLATAPFFQIPSLLLRGPSLVTTARKAE